MNDLEVKVRLCNNLRHWEDIPVTFETGNLSFEEAKELLEKLENWCNTEFVSSIRWNHKGDFQGHYFINRTIGADNKSYLNEEI